MAPVSSSFSLRSAMPWLPRRGALRRALKKTGVLFVMLSTLLTGFPVDQITAIIEHNLQKQHLITQSLPRVINSAEAALTPTGVVGFAETAADDNMQFLSYTSPNSYTDRGNSVDTTTNTNDLYHVVMKTSPVRDEVMSGQLESNGTLHITRCVGGCDASGDWSEELEISGVNTTETCDNTNAACWQGFDIAYEQLSGDAVVFYGKSANDGIVYFNIWNGTSWAGESSYTFRTSSTSDSNWIRAVARGEQLSIVRSDQIAVMMGDAGRQVHIAIWDGSSFGNKTTLTTTSAGMNERAFDCAWETVSGHVVAVYAEGTTNVVNPFRYKEWDGASTWDANGSAVLSYTATSTGEWVWMASDPQSNRIAVSLVNDANDHIWGIWKADGSTEGWTGGFEDATLEGDMQQIASVSWEKYNSGTPFAMVVYSDAGNVDVSDYETWTSGTGFSGATDMPGDAGNDGTLWRLRPSPNKDEIFAAHTDLDGDLCFQVWSGSAWDADCTAEYSTTIPPDSVAVEQETGAVDMTYRIFSPWTRNWRFYDDETVNDPSTGLNSAAENATPTNVDQEEFIRLRMQIEEMSDVLSQTDTRYKLQYTTGCNPNTSDNSCTWTDVGDTSETSAVWRYATAAETCASCSDNTAISTSRLTGTTNAGTYISDKDAAGGSNMDISANTIREFDYPLKAEAVTTSATYYFRLYDMAGQMPIYRKQSSGSSTDCTGAACTYPNLSIAAGAANVHQIHYRWRNDDGAEGATSWYSANWTYRKKITIDAGQVAGASSLTNFPMLFSVTDTSLKDVSNSGHVGQSDGGDIVFTNSSGTKLDHELVKYTPSTGEVIAWVEVDSVHPTSNTDIYVYYGYAGATDQWNITGTWSNSYAAVYHFTETAGAHQDSTTNNNDTTTTSVTTQGTATAKITGADDINAGNTLKVNDSNSLDLNSSFTISAWVNVDTYPSGSAFTDVLSKDIGYYLELTNSDDINCGFWAGGGYVDRTSTAAGLTTGTYYYVSCIFDDTANQLYIYSNGAQKLSVAETNAPSPGTGDMDIGNINAGSQSIDGKIDEITIASAARTTDWVITEYNNQNNPGVGGFLSSIGSEETQSTGATWAQNEDTTLSSASVGTNYRIRFELSNEGNADTGASTYGLELAETGTCSSGTYASVPTDTSGDWKISASTYLTDGEATTNVASGLTDENTSFVAGVAKDTGNTTSSITLTTTQFTEVEFSITPTSNATAGGSYCFRLSSANTYDQYGQATISNASPTFTLSAYRWYVDSDDQNVTEPWGSPDVAESTLLGLLPASNTPPEDREEIRLRVAITVGTNTLSAASQQFKLQYKAGTDATCTTGSWTDVSAAAGEPIWIFASSSVTDGTTLSATKLTASDVLEVYAKSNPTTTNPNGASVGQDIEYDFHIRSSGASPASIYSFRVVKSNDTLLDAYTYCPTLTTKQDSSQEMRYGNVFSEETEQGFTRAD